MRLLDKYRKDVENAEAAAILIDKRYVPLLEFDELRLRVYDETRRPGKEFYNRKYSEDYRVVEQYGSISDYPVWQVIRTKEYGVVRWFAMSAYTQYPIAPSIIRHEAERGRILEYSEQVVGSGELRVAVTNRAEMRFRKDARKLISAWRELYRFHKSLEPEIRGTGAGGRPSPPWSA